MVNVWESVDAATEAQNFCAIYGLTSPVLVDETGDYVRAVQVRGVPFNLVVDEAGVVIGAGLTHPDELVAFLEERGWLAPEPDDSWRRPMFLED